VKVANDANSTAPVHDDAFIADSTRFVEWLSIPMSHDVFSASCVPSDPVTSAAAFLAA
jgi:hypothetical protein